MRAGFEYYRAIPQDAMQNLNYSKNNLTMPVLTLQGGYIPVFGGNIAMLVGGSVVLYGLHLNQIKIMNVERYIYESLYYPAS